MGEGAEKGTVSDDNTVCPYHVDEPQTVFHFKFIVNTRYMMLDSIL